MCLVQLHAETSKPNYAGATSAKEVNSDPQAMHDEEDILQISSCALLTLRPCNVLGRSVHFWVSEFVAIVLTLGTEAIRRRDWPMSDDQPFSRIPTPSANPRHASSPSDASGVMF